MIPSAAADALRAAVLVAVGSSIGGPIRFVIGLPLVAAGLAFAIRAMNCVDRRTTEPVIAIAPWLALMAAVGLVVPVTDGGLWYDASKRVLSVLGLAAAGAFWRGSDRQRQIAVGAVVVVAVALHLVTPIAAPAPRIDVWIWTQACIDALVHGVHPYTVRMTHEIVDVQRLGPTALTFPYMPLTLLAFTPGYALLGDYRFVSALCVPATVVLNRATGVRLGLDRRFIDATTLAFLLYPRGTWLTLFGWTEPLLVALVSVFAYLASRTPGGTASAVAFLLLPALKQYVVAPVAIFLAMTRMRLAGLAFAVGVAAATVIPFLIWNWRATVEGMVVQMIAPVTPRLDALSFVALVARLTGVTISRWMSVAAQLLVGAIAYARLRHHGTGGLLLASSLALLATFLTGWQAFLNYYYFVTELLLLSAMFCASRDVVSWAADA
jgi:hypothetical protein